jgi:hypothetical protein
MLQVKANRMKPFSLIIILLLLFPSLTEAYLDPGAGSYILQMLIAGALGLMFTIKLYISKIKSFFSGLFGKENKEDDPDKE